MFSAFAPTFSSTWSRCCKSEVSLSSHNSLILSQEEEAEKEDEQIHKIPKNIEIRLQSAAVVSEGNRDQANPHEKVSCIEFQQIPNDL